MDKIDWKRTGLCFVINFIAFMILDPILNWLYGLIANSDYVFTISGDIKAALEFAVFFTLLDVLLEMGKSKKSGSGDKTEK